MSKHVLMINGSFRKKTTFNILVQIGQILKKFDIESEILNLFDYRINDCTGCDDICVRKGACSIEDEMPVIMKKIIDSDGIVLGSPVYLGGVTSKFKTFADRTNAWFHKPEPAGKPVLFVVTTATTGIKETKQFLQTFAAGFGARKGDFISRNSKNKDKPAEEHELTRFISLLENDKKHYNPAIKEIILFEVQKVMALKSSGDDNRFWQEKKWLDKYYYYDCQMGIGKMMFSKMMFRILSKAINS